MTTEQLDLETDEDYVLPEFEQSIVNKLFVYARDWARDFMCGDEPDDWFSDYLSFAINGEVDLTLNVHSGERFMGSWYFKADYDDQGNLSNIEVMG